MWGKLRILSKRLGIKRDIEDVKNGLRKAAVVVLLSLKDGEYRMLFVRRAKNLNYHKGQICFPGGGFNEVDGNLLETALRELREETGIDRKDVEVFFSIDALMPVTSPYCVLPFVAGLKNDVSPVPNCSEIEECFWVPLSFFFHSHFEIGEMNIGNKCLQFPVYYFNGKKIWGMTARVVVSLLEILNSLNVMGEEI